MRAYKYPEHCRDKLPYTSCAGTVRDIDGVMRAVCPDFCEFVRGRMRARAAALRASQSPTQHCYFMDPYALLITCASRLHKFERCDADNVDVSLPPVCRSALPRPCCRQQAWLRA
jgi:hypothetical protein